MTLQEACDQIGIQYKDVPADGKLHRVPVIGKDARNTSGRIKLFTDGAGGIVMNNVEAAVLTFWHDGPPVALTAADKAARAERIAQEKKELEEAYQQCRYESLSLWDNIARGGISATHQYLVAKGIKPYGARFQPSGGLLVVPVQDIDGTLHGLQFISGDGSKRFKTGTVKAGHFSLIHGSNLTIVCEGWATGCSIHEATSATVFVAFDAGNLAAVATIAAAARAGGPDSSIVIAADNDIDTAGNPGVSKASAAAAANNARLAVATFTPDQVESFRSAHGGKPPTDYNDLHQIAGTGAVRLQINVSAPVTDAPSTTSETHAGQWPEPIDLERLSHTAPQPPKFIIPDWLPCGYATLFAGHGGIGKSGLALILAVCMALGLPFFGVPVGRRRVLYLSCEDRVAVLHWRLSRICAYLDITLASLAGWLDILDLVGHDTILYQPKRDGVSLTRAYHQLAARVKTSSAQVLMIDGISDTYDGNENARAEVKAYVNAMLALIPPEDGAVILVGHVAKPATGMRTSEGYSGSTGWHNSVRARWYLYPETRTGDDTSRSERTGDLLLELQKSNLGATDRAMRFNWDSSAGIFVGREDAEETNFDRNYRQQQEQSGILAALRTCSGHVPAATSGQRTAYHVLSVQPDFPTSLCVSNADRKRFWRHIEKLRAMGQVEESTITRADRHKMRVLVAADKVCGDAGNVENQQSPHIDRNPPCGHAGNAAGGYKGGPAPALCNAPVSDDDNEVWA